MKKLIQGGTPLSRVTRFGDPIAYGKAGGGPSYDYTLLTDFSLVPNQPVLLSDGQVLNTPEEGVLDGSLSVVDTGVGNVTIDNDTAIITGSGSFTQAGLISNVLSWIENRFIDFDIQHGGGTGYFGLSTTPVLHTTPDIFSLRISSGTASIFIDITNTGLSITNVGGRTIFRFGIDIANNQIHIYAKRQSDEDFILEHSLNITFVNAYLQLHCVSGPTDVYSVSSYFPVNFPE